MISARQLTRHFGRLTAVDAMDFEIPRGGVVGFLGPNGAGKTTTIRMIAGYLPPSGGTVVVNGHDVTRDPLAARRQIGYLPESTPLYPELRVDEYLAFRGRLVGLDRTARRGAIDRAVERCDLGDVRRRPIRQLSKGYRQRVGLAGALLHDPPVLILDEPTVGLDPTQIRQFRTLMRDLAGGRTVLLSTHILAEAELSCDEVMLIERGRVRATGSIDALRTEVAAPCVVETERDPAATLRAVAGIDAVTVRTLDDGWYEARAIPREASADVRAALATALREAGNAVRELRRERPSLEQLFMRTVQGAAAEESA